MRLATALCAAVRSSGGLQRLPRPTSRSPRKRSEKPPIDSWTTFNGDYTGQRYSTLTQITPANVNQIAQQWVYKITGVARPARCSARDQMHAASGERGSLHHHSGPFVGRSMRAPARNCGITTGSIMAAI
jgi:hypothetical protein